MYKNGQDIVHAGDYDHPIQKFVPTTLEFCWVGMVRFVNVK